MELSRTIETETGEMIVKRVSVPLGLEELMEGLAKEVILKKPKDIYIFAAEYFSRLLQLRDSGLYRGNVRSAKLALKSPFRATVVGHNVLSNAGKRENGNIRGRKPPLPQKYEKNSKDVHEDRRAMIQNHLRQRHEIESQMNQKSEQNAKQPLARSRLPTRSRTPLKSTSDKSEAKSEIDATESSSRRSSSEKENNTQQKKTRKKISIRSRSTSVSSSSSTSEMKGKKRMDVVKEKNSKICGTEVLNELSGAAKAHPESVELINESQCRGIQRSISVTQDKDGHYEVLNRPTPLHLGDRYIKNIPSDQSNGKTNVDENKSLNDGVTNSKQSESVDALDEVKSAIAIQALWRGRKDRQMLKERSAKGTGINEVNSSLDKRPTSADNPNEINQNTEENNYTPGASTVENSSRRTESPDSTLKSHSEGDKKVEEYDGIDEGLKSLNKENENDGENLGTEKVGACKDDTQNEIGEDEINNASKEQPNVNIEITDLKSENDDENSRRYHRSQTLEVSNKKPNEEQNQKEIETSDQETLQDSSASQGERFNHTGLSSPPSQVSLEKSQDDNLLGDSTPHDLIRSGKEPTEHGESPKVLEDEKEKLVDSVNVERSPNHAVAKNGGQIEVLHENEKTEIDKVENIVHTVSQISTSNAESFEPPVSATKKDSTDYSNEDEKKDIDGEPTAQRIQNETASVIRSESHSSPSEEDVNKATNDDEQGKKDNDGSHTTSHEAPIETSNDEAHTEAHRAQIELSNNDSSDTLSFPTEDDAIKATKCGEDVNQDELLTTAHDAQKGTTNDGCVKSHSTPSEDSDEANNDNKEGDEDDDGSPSTAYKEQIETAKNNSSASHGKDTNKATNETEDEDSSHNTAPKTQIETMDSCSEAQSSHSENDVEKATNDDENGNNDIDEAHSVVHEAQLKAPMEEILNPPAEKDIRKADFKNKRSQSHNVQNLDRTEREKNGPLKKAHSQDAENSKTRRKRSVQQTSDPNTSAKAVGGTDLEINEHYRTEESASNSVHQGRGQSFGNDETTENVVLMSSILAKTDGEVEKTKSIQSEQIEVDPNSSSNEKNEGSAKMEHTNEDDILQKPDELMDDVRSEDHEKERVADDGSTGEIEEKCEQNEEVNSENTDLQGNIEVALEKPNSSSVRDRIDDECHKENENVLDGTKNEENFNTESEQGNKDEKIHNETFESGLNTFTCEEDDQNIKIKSTSNQEEAPSKENGINKIEIMNRNNEGDSSISNDRNESLSQNTENNELPEKESSDNVVDTAEHDEKGNVDIETPNEIQNAESQEKENKETTNSVSDSNIANCNSNDENNGENNTNQKNNIDNEDNSNTEKENETRNLSVNFSGAEKKSSSEVFDPNVVNVIKEPITEKADNKTNMSENSEGHETVVPHSLEREIEELNGIQDATVDNKEVKKQDGIMNEADVKPYDSNEKEQKVSTNEEHHAKDGNVGSLSEVAENESSSSEKESAIRIQTIWRGYQARKHLKDLLERNFKETEHSSLIKELSVESIKDENENLPETKNENLVRDKENINESNESTETGDEGIEDSEKNKEMGGTDLEKSNIFNNDENEAALKIQSEFRKSQENRLQTGSTVISNQDMTKSVNHHEGEIDENNKVESEVERKILGDLSSAGFKGMKDEKSYTDEEQNAALKIQKAFRKSKNVIKNEQGSSSVDTSDIFNQNEKEEEGEEKENSKEAVSSEISDSKNLVGFSSDEVKAATKIQSTFRKSRKQRLKPKLEDLDLNSDMGKEYLKEILKIQSAWRAYKVRKNIRDVERKITTMENMSGSHTKKSIHLTDQEILKAVTKIQAGLRGYLTRKHFNNIRERNEALDRIKEESYSDYSRMSSTSSTDDQLLEILKQVEGAKIPDTVPEIHPEENSEKSSSVHNNMKDMVPEQNQGHTVEKILQSHFKPSDSNENLDKSGVNMLEKNEDQKSSEIDDAENRNKSDGESFEQNDESVTLNLKDFEEEEPNKLPPKHSSNKLIPHEVKNPEESNLESQIETDFIPSSDSGEVSSEISTNNQNSERNIKDGIDTKNSPEKLKSETEIDSKTAENEIKENVENQMSPKYTHHESKNENSVESIETANSSDQEKKDILNQATSQILDFPADTNGKHDEDLPKYEYKDRNLPSKSDLEHSHSAMGVDVQNRGSLGLTDQIDAKQADLHDVDSVEKLSSTEIAVRNEEIVESGSSNDTTDENNIGKPENAENSKNGQTSRRSLKKSKAIDNLAELAEKLESNNEKAEDLKRSTSAPHKALSEENLNDSEKSVTFEIPDDFKPCVQEKRFSEDLGLIKNPETTEHDSVESAKKEADTDVLESNSSQLTNASRGIDEMNNASNRVSVPNEETENKTNTSLIENDHPKFRDPLTEKNNETNQKVQINSSEDASNCAISKETKKLDEDIDEKDSKSIRPTLTVGDEYPETDEALVEIEEKIDKKNHIKTCEGGSNCAIPKETKTLEKDTEVSTDSLNEKEPKSPRPTLTDFMKKTLDFQPLQSNQKHETTQGTTVISKKSENSEISLRNRNDSAIKIQSSYRGFKARKYVKRLKSSMNAVAASVALAHNGEKNNPSQSTDVSTSDAVMNGSSDDKNHNKDLNVQETRTNDVGVGSNGNVNSAGSQESVPGVEILTTETQHSTDVGEASGDVERDAQPSASVGDSTNTQDVLSNKPEVESECKMESKRNNSTLRNKNMEAEAATKIQAGFRGYKVRRELKMKDTPSEATIKKTVRRKNSSCLADNQAKKQKENIDLEEKSAVKIQAGIRGFLVRKRNKRPQKSQE